MILLILGLILVIFLILGGWQQVVGGAFGMAIGIILAIGIGALTDD